MDLRLDDQARRHLTLVLAGTLVVAGWTTLLLGKFDSGVRLALNGDRVTVDQVIPGSIAAQYGLQEGMVVTQLQGVTLIEMPHYIDPDPAMPSPDPTTGETPPYIPTIEPSTPQTIQLDPALLDEPARASADTAQRRPALGSRCQVLRVTGRRSRAL